MRGGLDGGGRPAAGRFVKRSGAKGAGDSMCFEVLHPGQGAIFSIFGSQQRFHL